LILYGKYPKKAEIKVNNLATTHPRNLATKPPWVDKLGGWVDKFGGWVAKVVAPDIPQKP
jgi:hypothetical protein